MTAQGRLLVVTAVPPERDAVLSSGIEGVDVQAVGVGAVAAASGTTRLLTMAEGAGRGYAAVLCAGVAGGFSGRIGVGGVAIASVSVAADAGAHSPAGFLPLEDIGLGSARVPADAGLLDQLTASLPRAVVGPILTVTATTGTAQGTEELLERHPAAVAEAMEGYGVAVAARLVGVAHAEIRTISNLIGPRDLSEWRMSLALRALTETFVTLRRNGLGHDSSG